MFMENTLNIRTYLTEYQRRIESNLKFDFISLHWRISRKKKKSTWFRKRIHFYVSKTIGWKFYFLSFLSWIKYISNLRKTRCFLQEHAFCCQYLKEKSIYSIKHLSFRYFIKPEAKKGHPLAWFKHRYQNVACIRHPQGKS